MAKNLADLCTLLVEDHYGEVPSRIFSVLLRYGRLSLHALIQSSHLSAKHVKHGLVVLIQQHLVLHHTSDDDDGGAYYDANMQHAYNLVRSGKIIDMVNQRFGEAAAGITSNLLLLGHAKVSDLVEAYGFGTRRRAQMKKEEVHLNGDGLLNGVNSSMGEARRDDDPHFKNANEFHRTLRPLLLSGFVIPVWSNHFQIQRDLYNETRPDALAVIGKKEVEVKAKEEPRIAQTIASLIRERRDYGTEDEESEANAGVKRKSEANDDRPHKRPRVNGIHTNGVNGINHEDDDADPPVEPTLVLRVSFEKCCVALRNQQLVDLSARFIGHTTSKVYETLLRLLEPNIPRCYDEYHEYDTDQDADNDGPYITTTRIARALDPVIDVSSGVAAVDSRPNSSSGSMHGAGEYYDNDDNLGIRSGLHDVPSAVANDDKRLNAIDCHLRLLERDPRRFIRFTHSGGAGRWQVDFRRLTRSLIQQELETTVRGIYGPLAARLVRVLHASGKLDEKQIGERALVRAPDLKVVLQTLQKGGLLELQEIPRDKQRTPSKAIYLWYFDQERCRDTILDETYKAMTRLVQRAKVESDTQKPLIEKAQRTDVVGKEDRYLSKAEREALQSWRAREEMILTQLGRQDDLVALFRDFLPQKAAT